MDRYQGQHDHATNRVDEYGNRVAGHGATATGGMGGAHGGIAPGAFTGTGTGGQFQPSREEHKTGGILHRSGSSSSSSSSSEDDGMGGRRKKGMKEKIKEKLPGGHEDNQYNMGATGGGAYGQQGRAEMTGAGTGAHGVDGTGEKKGLMDKIKEKLPGQH